jgi:glycosyltransferase involved in cell wall biosynthesis
MGNPRVSVLLLTYNHASWVGQCLASVLAQQGRDAMELVWHDDASTDDTVAHAEAVLAGSDLTVKRLLRRHNRMGRGIPNHLDLLEACEGDFVALLEGDDFWCHPQKTAMQLQALDAMPAVDLCFARARKLQVEPNGRESDAGFVADLGDAPGLASLSTVIRGDGGFMHTGSILLRRRALLEAPRWFHEFQPVGDYLFQVLGAARGGALYLPQVLSTYRAEAMASWSDRMARSPDARVAFEVAFIRLLRQMQTHFGPAHKEDFDDILARHLSLLARLSLAHGRPDSLVRAAASLLPA